MLLLRSILLKVCLVLVVHQAHSQNYDYSVNEDHEDVSDDQPDYSKYYSVDQSAPLTTQDADSGFVSPIEFSSFFGPSPIEFGASNQNPQKKPLASFLPTQKPDPFTALKSEFPEYNAASTAFPKDYFEEAQKEEEVGPGPNYISHQIPAEEGDRYSSSNEDAETITTKPKRKNYDQTEDFAPKPNKYNRKNVDYSTGKSSSTVSQYPSAEGYTTLSPYQKFSFQPDYFGDATAAPFNPSYAKIAEEASESLPTRKNCKKITKAAGQADTMNCFVCENPQTKSKYTQCSYTSEPEPVNQYLGNSERYSTPNKYPDGFRYKRYSNQDAYSSDPYEYIKTRAEINYEAPTGKTGEETNDGYYLPEHYTEDFEPEKSFSEAQSEELKKNPENCRKIVKEGMTCTICKNAKTGGNYEQCSYTSEPNEKKYAYVTEKKYESEEPEESKPVSKILANKDENIEPIEEYEGRRKNNKRPERNHKEARRRNEESRFGKALDEEERSSRQKYAGKTPKYASAENSQEQPNYELPKDFTDTTKYSSKYQEEPKKSRNHQEASSEIGEYEFKLFPEFENQESKQDEAIEYPEASKQDVEVVLAAFTKKDRTNCKKAEKNGMTCYLCVDANKIQQEECMYVSESRPQSKKIIYREAEQFHSPEESKISSTVVPVVEKKKPKKKANILVLENASSENVKKVWKPKKKIVQKRKEPVGAASQYDTERIEQEPTIKTPVEFVVADEEGAYSEETKPVYSKSLGVQLPKYMLEKSDFEKEFDAFSGSF